MNCFYSVDNIVKKILIDVVAKINTHVLQWNSIQIASASVVMQTFSLFHLKHKKRYYANGFLCHSELSKSVGPVGLAHKNSSGPKS